MSSIFGFTVIVAMDENRGIGRANELPWHLPEDLKHFREVTCQVENRDNQNAVIMGRKTWESLPQAYRPLPHRKNIVLSRKHLNSPPEVMAFSDFDAAIRSLSAMDRIEKIFVIGGGQVFETAIRHSQCQEILVTEIQDSFKCDVFFPDISSRFGISNESVVFQSKTGLSYKFISFKPSR
nr:Dihydrofolate reductase [uncultured bacterium]